MSKLKEFGMPDAPAEENGTTPEQNTPKPEQKEPKATASKPNTDALAYDLSDYINQSREKASTGQRQKLEANEFNDESLLNEAGYSSDGEPEAIVEEAEEVETEEQPTEISEEWLEIFAWAGVEVTDEAMPILLAYLHAESDKTRFKLKPDRRDKLKLAWIAFLRRVLPPLDDKGGLLLVIIMLYIENLVVGIWKTIMRVMNGTFTWPNFWIFKRWNKPTAPKPEPAPSPSPQPQPQPTNADVEALAPNVVAPAPTVKAGEAPIMQNVIEAQPKQLEAPKEPLNIYGPEPIDLDNGKRQDPFSDEIFDKKKGQPTREKVMKSKRNGRLYHIKARTFKNQSSYQRWLRENNYYKTLEEINNPEE